MLIAWRRQLYLEESRNRRIVDSKRRVLTKLLIFMIHVGVGSYVTRSLKTSFTFFTQEIDTSKSIHLQYYYRFAIKSIKFGNTSMISNKIHDLCHKAPCCDMQLFPSGTTNIQRKIIAQAVTRSTTGAMGSSLAKNL